MSERNPDMRTVKIAIDPNLMDLYGPEICWTWRLLLSGIGLSWQQVAIDSLECDIAYMTQQQAAENAKFCVCANRKAWGEKSRSRLATVSRTDGLLHPIYAGETRPSRLFFQSNGCLVSDRDLIFDIFWLATGQEEQHWPRNQHGHFDLAATSIERESVLRLALASSIASGLEKNLVQLGLSAALPRWPHGKRAAACVGHDVDYPEVVRWLEPLRIVYSRGRQAFPAAFSVLLGRRHHWHFPSWLQMEKRLNIRSAFYFVPRLGSLLSYAAGTPDPFYDIESHRFKHLFKYLADEGAEIGLHASYRSHESEKKFAAEKQRLEEASGQTIYGNRHHYWHLKPGDPESTLLIHEKVGLIYDSSLAHERYVGWRRGLSWPFFPFHQKARRELKTLQISTAWMDDQLFGHKSHNPGNPLEILRSLADTAAQQGGCLNIDVHDYVFDDLLFPAWAKTSWELLKYIRDRSDFWVATPAQVAQHWLERHETITKRSHGLTGHTAIGH